tara:strand:- start:9253 stop:16962 length:7710 start_codon:yes stop_codon:yes gene_type:complete
MGTYNTAGPYSGKPYSFTISGNVPTDTEYGRISEYLRQFEDEFKTSYESKYGEYEGYDDGTVIGRAYRRGRAGGASDRGELVESVGQQSGLGGLYDYGSDLEEAGRQRSGELLLEQSTADRDITDFKDVDSLSTGLNYLGNLAGGTLASGVSALQGGLYGAGVGGIGGLVTGGPAGAVAGAGTGFAYGTVAGLVPEFAGGNINRREAEVGEDVDVNVVSALAVGTAQAAAERFGLKALATLGLSKQDIADKLLARIAKGGAKGAIVEGSTETFQSAAERMYAGLPLLDEDGQNELLNALVGGVLLGGGVSATGRGVFGKRPETEQLEQTGPQDLEGPQGPQGEQDLEAQNNLRAGTAEEAAVMADEALAGDDGTRLLGEIVDPVTGLFKNAELAERYDADTTAAIVEKRKVILKEKSEATAAALPDPELDAPVKENRANPDSATKSTDKEKTSAEGFSVANEMRRLYAYMQEPNILNFDFDDAAEHIQSGQTLESFLKIKREEAELDAEEEIDADAASGDRTGAGSGVPSDATGPATPDVNSASTTKVDSSDSTPVESSDGDPVSGAAGKGGTSATVSTQGTVETPAKYETDVDDARIDKLGLEVIPYESKKYDDKTAQVSDVAGKSPFLNYSGRILAMRTVNGVKVPFYLSSGQAGKDDASRGADRVAKGKWYPIFGISKDGWINKGSAKQINSYYDNAELKKAAQELDQEFGDIAANASIPKIGLLGSQINFINSNLDVSPPDGNNDSGTVQSNIKSVLDRIAAGRNASSVDEQQTTPIKVSTKEAENLARIAEKRRGPSFAQESIDKLHANYLAVGADGQGTPRVGNMSWKEAHDRYHNDIKDITTTGDKNRVVENLLEAELERPVRPRGSTEQEAADLYAAKIKLFDDTDAAVDADTRQTITNKKFADDTVDYDTRRAAKKYFQKYRILTGALDEIAADVAQGRKAASDNKDIDDAVLVQEGKLAEMWVRSNLDSKTIEYLDKKITEEFNAKKQGTGALGTKTSKQKDKDNAAKKRADQDAAAADSGYIDPNASPQDALIAVQERIDAQVAVNAQEREFLEGLRVEGEPNEGLNKEQFNRLKALRKQDKENNEAIAVAKDAIRARQRELEDKAQQGTITVLEQGELDSITGGREASSDVSLKEPLAIAPDFDSGDLEADAKQLREKLNKWRGGDLPETMSAAQKQTGYALQFGGLELNPTVYPTLSALTPTMLGARLRLSRKSDDFKAQPEGTRAEILALDKDTVVSGAANEIYENAVAISLSAAEVANTAEFAEAEAGLAPETLMREELPYDTIGGIIASLEERQGMDGMPDFAEGDFASVLDNIAAGAEVNSLVAKAATQMANILRARTKSGKPVTKVMIIPNLRLETKDDGSLAVSVGSNSTERAGAFDPKTNTIYLDEETGLNEHVIMHEAAHAFLSHKLGGKSELKKAINPIVTAMKRIPDFVDSEFDTSNIDEFLAEFISNAGFRKRLQEAIPSPEATDQRSIYERVIGAIKAILTSGQVIPTKARAKQDNMVKDLDALVLDLLSAAPNERDAVVMPFTTAGMASSMAAGVGNVQRRVNSLAPRDEQAIAHRAVATLGMMPRVARKAFFQVTPMARLVEIAEDAGIKGARKLMDAISNKNGAISRMLGELDAVNSVLVEFRKDMSEDRYRLWTDLLNESNIYSVDPTLTEKQAEKEYLSSPDPVGMDISGQDKFDAWKKLSKQYGKLNARERAARKQLLGVYSRLYDQIKDIIYAKIDDNISDPAAAARLKNDVFGKLFGKGRLVSFLPLARKGEFKLTFTASPNPDAVKEAGKLPQINGIQYYGNTTESPVLFFETELARQQFMQDLASGNMDTSDFIISDITPFESLDNATFGGAPENAFVKEVLNALDEVGVSEEAKTAIMELAIDAMPETSFAKAFQKRKSVPGFIVDPLEAFSLRAYSLGSQIEDMKASRNIRAAQAEVYTRENMGAGGINSDILDELKSGADYAINPPNDAIARAVNKTAFAWTLMGNVSSALVNLSSVPIVVAPYLAGEYGAAESATALYDALAMFTKSGFSHNQKMLVGNDEEGAYRKVRALPSLDNYFELKTQVIKDEETGAEREVHNYVVRSDLGLSDARKAELQDLSYFVKEMSDLGSLNRSLFYDSLGVEGSSVGRSLTDTISVWGGSLFHTVERANRQATLLATYNLELKRLRTQPQANERGMSNEQMMAQAVRKASDVTARTGGSALIATAPPLSKQSLGRVALMFKTYGITLLHMQLKLAKDLIYNSDLSKRERTIAAKQLLGVMGSSTLLAGVSGMPLYGAYVLIADMIFDDEEDDADTVARKYLGETVFKGLPSAMLGVDLSSRIGLSGLIIRNNKFNADASVEETIVQGLGGPAWGVFSSWRRGAADLANGEFQRGIESILPSAIRNPMKAMRYSDIEALGGEGTARTRRFDPITDDISTGGLVGLMFGFNPSNLSFNQELNQNLKGIDKAITSRRTKLLKKFYLATAKGDGRGREDALLEIREFNERHGPDSPKVVISPDTILRSIKQHFKTTATMHYGVVLSGAIRQMLLNNAEEYNNGFNLSGEYVGK